MDRTRETRILSMATTTDKFSRQSKRNRNQDRDSSNKSKRSSGFHKEEGEQSTEESVGNEQDYELEDGGVSRILSPNTASSSSDQKGIPPVMPGRPSPPPWKIANEVIGVAVPRKARSASTKRSHDSWVSASGGHGVEAASPSSLNVSLPKKMKANGPKTHLPKMTKSSSSTQEDIEFEIAEVLYGLMTSKNQESSQKLKPNCGSKTLIPSQNVNSQTSVFPPRSNNSLSSLSSNVDKQKVEEYNSLILGSKSSTSKLVKIKSSQQAKVDTFSHEFDSMTGELPSPAKLDARQERSVATKVVFAIPDANCQHVEKFKIDLMAPLPMVLSPERDDLSKDNFTSQTRDLVLEVELRTKNNAKIEDKERLNKNALEEINDMKVDTYKEEQDKLKIDLEMPKRDIDCLTRYKLEERDKKQEQPLKLTYLKVEKTEKSTPVSLLTTVPTWSSILPSTLGYMPPPQTVVNIDKTIGSSTAPQHMNFALSPPQSKRCATHHYIARNIFLHQQFIRMNHIWPEAVGSGSVCGAELNNINGVPTSETMGTGQQSQKNLLSVNLNASQATKELPALSIPRLDANKSSEVTKSLDSTQRKQQGPYPASTCNVMHGYAFLFPLGQHETTSTTVESSQARGVNSTGNASFSNKSNSSSTGSLGISSALPTVATTMSFSYPNLVANDAPHVTIVQNNWYPFPFSTPQGATTSTRGASPAPTAHALNRPLYSSQVFHNFQHPQHPHSQPFVQPSYLDTSTSIGSSSSHMQPRGAQVNGSNILSSTTMQLQQSQKQSTSQSDPHNLETKTSQDNATSVASRTCYSQKKVFGQNLTIPFQPVNLSFRQTTTSDSVGGNTGNFGDKKQEAFKGGVELVPSPAFAISFAEFNGTSVPSNLSFSSMAQSPVIFHSLSNVAWQGYDSPGTSHSTRQKSYSMPEGKSGGNSARQDDEKKVTSRKSSTKGPTTLVFDNSSKNLSFAFSPTNGSWPSHSVSSPAIKTNAPLSSDTSSSLQLLQLQKQHNVQQQQPSLATRYKTSTSTNSASKFVNNPSLFSHNFTQCNNYNPSSHSKSSGRTSDSQVLHTSVITTTASAMKNVSQEQGRVLQDHTHISFGGNYKSSLPPQGQQLLNNNKPLNTKPNSQGSKIGSSINNLQTQQAENASVGTGKKSSLVCGRNVPSILISGPSHLSELKY